MALVLWHTDGSVCSQKARLALAEVSTEWEAYVPDFGNMEQHTAQYRAVNPDGVVPVLIDDGMIVRESSLIVEYLDATRNGGCLMPESGPDRVAAKLWLIKSLAIHEAINSVTFATSIRNIDLKRSPEEREKRWSSLPNAATVSKRRDLFANGTGSSYVAGALYEIRNILKQMTDLIERDGWVSGKTYAMGDLALTAYFDRIDRLGLGQMIRSRPAVNEWLTRCRARPSYDEAIASRIGPPPEGEERDKLEAVWKDVPGAT